MGLKKIIKKLSGLYEMECDGGGEYSEALDELICKLKKKRENFEQKLSAEKSSSKRKHYKLELKIIRAELKKAQGLKRECGGK